MPLVPRTACGTRPRASDAKRERARARARTRDEISHYFYVTKVGPQFRPDLYNSAARRFDLARGGKFAPSTMSSAPRDGIDISFGTAKRFPSQMAARRLSLSAETPIDDDAVQHGRPFVQPRDPNSSAFYFHVSRIPPPSIHSFLFDSSLRNTKTCCRVEFPFV